MSNKHHTSLLRALTTGFLVVGITLLCSVSTQALFAQDDETGGGVTLLHPSPQWQMPATLEPASLFHASAPEIAIAGKAESAIQTQFLLGLFFILGGCLFHMLYVLRNENVRGKDSANGRIRMVRLWFEERLDRPW